MKRPEPPSNTELLQFANQMIDAAESRELLMTAQAFSFLHAAQEDHDLTDEECDRLNERAHDIFTKVRASLVRQVMDHLREAFKNPSSITTFALELSREGMTEMLRESDPPTLSA